MAYDIDIIPIIEHYTSQPLPGGNRPFKILCLNHEETRPSMSVDPKRNTFRCYVCVDFYGDTIDLVEQMEGVAFGEALRFIEAITGDEIAEVSADPAQSSRGKPPSLFGGGSGAKRGNHRPVSTGVRGKPRGVRGGS